MFKAFSAILCALLFCLCNNADEAQSPLTVFRTFLKLKNNGKLTEAYDLLSKDSLSQVFFDEWNRYIKQSSQTEVLHIKKSSCIIYSTEIQDTALFVFRETFLQDTSIVKMIKENGNWKLSIVKYPLR